MVDFLYGAPKTCRLFKVSVTLPPSGKISAGAHEPLYVVIACWVVLFQRICEITQPVVEVCSKYIYIAELIETE